MRGRPEGSSEFLRPRQRAIDERHRQAAGAQPIRDGAGGAAGAEHDGVAGGLAPVGNRDVEMGQKPVHVGVAADELSVLVPDRVDGADRVRGFVAPGERTKGRLLVRDRNVGADIAAPAQVAEEVLEIGRGHVGELVGAGNPKTFEPEAVQLGRARVRHRMADHAGLGNRRHATNPAWRKNFSNGSNGIPKMVK